MGTRKRTKAQKKCQWHIAVQTIYSEKPSGLGHRICDRNHNNQWHGYNVCDRHRRLLQDHEIERLRTYQKWETEIDMIAS